MKVTLAPVFSYTNSGLLLSLASVVYRRVYVALFLLLVVVVKQATDGQHSRQLPCRLVRLLVRPCASRTRSPDLDVRSANVAMSRYAAYRMFLMLRFSIVSSR
jgi:hypothetical protein